MFVLTGLPWVAKFVRPSPFSEKSHVLGQHPREENCGFDTPARTALKHDGRRDGEKVEVVVGEL